MQKTYVLDANVLLQAPYALESFEDNHIVLPLAVLEELDALKGADGEAGNNARQALRFPGGPAAPGRFGKGRDPCPVEAPCAWRSTMWTRPSPRGIEPDSRAGRVLKVCRGLLDEGTPVTLVSRDMVARIRAQNDGGAGGGLHHRPAAGRRPALYRPGGALHPRRSAPGLQEKGAPAGELYAVDGAGERKPGFL